ncbi:cyanophycin synthetase [uncultured Sphingomonas sp.]|uniref:cyanophycin synthetase n=1 Tax=uncultured Sphingomonas sp. TaxID=158754 RepID=UPI0035CBA19A
MTSRPLRVVERAVYRGPHLYGLRPMIRIQIDLGALEEWPSDRLPGFADRLLALLPGLEDHGCSYGEPGGFVRRLRDGTWLGHVIEHVALELQGMAGHPVTRGKTRGVKDRPGVYDVLFRYRDEHVGLMAGAHAIRLVASLLPPELARIGNWASLRQPELDEPGSVSAIMAALAVPVAAARLGPTTQGLVDAARRRGIPAVRLNAQSLVQFGTGSRQRRIRASVTGATSLIGAELAGDKNAAKALLGAAGLPVPRGGVARSPDQAVLEARRLRGPVVMKPLDGNHGRGVTTDITTQEGARAAFALAQSHSRGANRAVIVERQLPGRDHRVLVVGGRMVACAERVPARVIGDGASTIAELIAVLNRDPRRGRGHAQVLTRILPDAAMRTLLEKDGRTFASVPAPGEEVALRSTANLSSGGTAIDRTDEIHLENAAIAEQAAAVIGLDVAGIDLLSPDIARPLRETGGGIVEVNAAPGLRMHLQPSDGTPRDVARPVIDMLFPRGRASRVPVFAITGTNGKSTTTRMVARILCEAGLRVGMTTTSGVYVEGRLLQAADASGPKSARMLLRNPTVDAVVLETARGGILREGLGFDRCDVGAVLNVTADHLGIGGIDTIEELARVKSVVARAVARRGHCVLNADDPITVRMARRAGGKTVWFSVSGGDDMPPFLRAHIDEGGLAVVREPGPLGGTIALWRGARREPLMDAADIPATLGGSAEFNIANALAAAAMTTAHGIDIAVVRRALGQFTSSFEDSPGRLNIHEAPHGVRVIVDYAHNAAAITALGRLIDTMRTGRGRVYGVVSIPGDRRDEDLLRMGELAAGIFDEVIFREAPDGRGRPAGSINALMTEGALSTGKNPRLLHRLPSEEVATQVCLEAARPGDLIVIMPSEVERIWNQVVSYVPAAHQFVEAA